MSSLLPRLFLSFLSVASCFLVAAAETAKPNIVVILVDDMGYSDIGPYGSEIPTPHLDALAKNGLRFSQFYNIGRCCPTRASLLTGLYPHQAGVGHMTEDKGIPGYSGRIHPHTPTLPEALRPAGYFTAMAGKWHVGQNHGVTPWTRGFDRSLNPPAGGFYFPKGAEGKLFLNGKPISPTDPRLPRDWYSTDLWTTFGLTFIDEALAAKKPFFLYLAHNAPHFPLQAPADEIAKFRGKYKAGWDKLRQERHARQVASGLIDPSWKLAPRPDTIAAWDSLSAKEQDRFDHLMAVYAATVSRMDKAIGDLVSGLKARGQLENTLILFMSDNGGNAESGPNGRSNGDPTQSDSSWFCGESWAYLQNTPFRYFKHYNHEGGIATPLIAHWPAGLASTGQTTHQPAHLIDVMATCLEISGTTFPDTFNGQKTTPPEGIRLTPVFAGKPLARSTPIYFEHEGHHALRDGPWKLVSKGDFKAPWELYDMTADRTETNNLAAQHPERANQLAAAWIIWAKRTHVLPLPDEDSGKKPRKKKPNSAE